MATFNSVIYAQSIGQPSTGVGVAAPIPTYGDGQHNGGFKRSVLVAFNTALQNLAIASVVNVAVLPQGVTVTNIKVISDTGTASATVQLGVTGTANYYSSSAQSLASAGAFDVINNFANYGQATTAPTTVIATIAGAAVNTGNLYFAIDYLSN